MVKRKKLVSIDEAKPASGQHTQPCPDCPWARESLRGWLGGMTADQWLVEAHSDCRIECHTLLGAQCAGAAIYRANVSKKPRDPEVIQLGTDRVKVFATPMEFKAHHEKKK